VAAQAAIERALVDGRRFEPTKPSLFDEEAGEAVLAAFRGFGSGAS
jgi:hypothetical protein